MKNCRFIYIIILMSIFISPVNILAEENSEEQEAVLIETFNLDITGDGQDETIELKGILFSKDSSYYRNIWIEITNELKNEWTIDLGGGYEPDLQFIDLNHDKVKDILYQSPTGGSGGLYNYELHTFSNGEHEKIDLPEQSYIKGKFKGNFQVEIEISPMSQPIIVDVSDRKDNYVSIELYDKNGKLLSPTSLIIDPIAFYEPLYISESKGYGLKSYQQLSGAYHADRLGTIETMWYLENGNWVVLQTEWIPADASE